MKMVAALILCIFMVSCTTNSENDIVLEPKNLELSVWISGSGLDRNTFIVHFILSDSIQTGVSLSTDDYYKVEFAGKEYTTQLPWINLDRTNPSDTIVISAYIGDKGLAFKGGIRYYPNLDYHASVMGDSFKSTIQWSRGELDTIQVGASLACSKNDAEVARVSSHETNLNSELFNVDFTDFADSLNRLNDAIDLCMYEAAVSRDLNGWVDFNTLKQIKIFWREISYSNEYIEIK